MNSKNKKFVNSGESKEKFIELRAMGMSYESIAIEIGVSRQTLQVWSRDLKADIENSKAVRMDALQAKYRLFQMHQVEIFGQLLDKIRSELEKRELCEVPTPRLMEMFLKYSVTFNEFNKPPEFVEKKSPLEFAMLDATYESRPMP